MANNVTSGTLAGLNVGQGVYFMNSDTLYEVYQNIFNPSFLDSLIDGFTNKLEFINSVRVYPIDFSLAPATQLTKSNMNIGDKEITVSILDNAIYSYEHGFSYNLIKTISISRYYNDYRDYEPYTKIKIWLPFYGFINVSPSEVYDKPFQINFIVDFLTGEGKYILQSGNPTLNEQRILDFISFKLGVDIPLGGSNNTRQNQNIFNYLTSGIGGSLQTVIGAGTGNPFATAGGIYSTLGVITNAPNTQTETAIKLGSNGQGQTMYNLPRNIIVIYERVKSVDTTSYDEILGKPLNEVRTLSSLTGFTQIGNIHLEGFTNALTSELNEIETLLKQGVLL